MDQLKRKRGAQSDNITRIQNKLQKMLKDDLSTLNLQLLKKYLDDIRIANETYKGWHSTIEEQFADQIDTNEEDKLLLLHMESSEEVESLAKLLIDVCNAMTMATSLMTHMTDVKTLMAKNSDKSYELTDIKLEFYSLKVLIQRSTIAHDSQVYQLFEEQDFTLSCYAH